MDKINEKSGISSAETEALFLANQKDKKNFSLFLKIKDTINRKKSEKMLKTADVCKVLDDNQR